MSKITSDPTGLLLAAEPRRDAGGLPTGENQSDFADRLAEASAEDSAATTYREEPAAAAGASSSDDAGGGGSDGLSDHAGERDGGEQLPDAEDSSPGSSDDASSSKSSADETLVVIIGAEPTAVVAETPLDAGVEGVTSVATVGLAIGPDGRESGDDRQGSETPAEIDASPELIDTEALLDTDAAGATIREETELADADTDLSTAASAQAEAGEVAFGPSSTSREGGTEAALTGAAEPEGQVAAAEAAGDQAPGDDSRGDSASTPESESSEGESVERPAVSASPGQTAVKADDGAAAAAERSLAKDGPPALLSADTANLDAVEAKPADSSASSRVGDASEPLARIAAGRLPTSRVDQAETGAAPRVDASRFVSRVSRAVESAQQRGGEIRIRLSPPELGALQIKLSLNEGVMTAALETETNAARNVLLDNLPALRERLAEQEIQIEKFDVDVRDEGRQTRDNAADERDRRHAERDATRSQSSNAAGADSPKPVAGAGVTLPSNHNPDAINVVA